jgi:hypothetical protein
VAPTGKDDSHCAHGLKSTPFLTIVKTFDVSLNTRLKELTVMAKSASA